MKYSSALLKYTMGILLRYLYGMLCCLLLPSTLTVAQDTIIKMNRDVIPAKVIEIGPNIIRFEKSKGNETVIKTIDRKDVYMIKYVNGQKDTIAGKRFDDIRVPKSNMTANSPTIPGNGWIYVTVSDLFFHLVSGGVMFTLPGGYVSLEVPVSFGMVYLGMLDTVPRNFNAQNHSESDGDYYNPNKTYSTGLSINFYPTPQYKARFFMNLSLGTGQFKYTDYYENYQAPPYNYISKEMTGTYNSVFTKIGVRFLPEKHINLSFNVGIGFTKTKTSYYLPYPATYAYETRIHPGIEGGLHIGYSF